MPPTQPWQMVSPSPAPCRPSSPAPAPSPCPASTMSTPTLGGRGGWSAQGRPAEPRGLSAPRPRPSSGCCLPRPLPPSPTPPHLHTLLPDSCSQKHPAGAPSLLGAQGIEGVHSIASAPRSSHAGFSTIAGVSNFLPSVPPAVQTPGAVWRRGCEVLPPCPPGPSRVERTLGAGPGAHSSSPSGTPATGNPGPGGRGGRVSRRGCVHVAGDRPAQSVLGTSGGGHTVPRGSGHSRASLARKQRSAPRGSCGLGSRQVPLQQGGWVGRRSGKWAGASSTAPGGSPSSEPGRPCLSLARGCVLGWDSGAGSRGGLGVPAPGSGVRAGGWGTCGAGGRRWRGEAGWECKQR